MSLQKLCLVSMALMVAVSMALMVAVAKGAPLVPSGAILNLIGPKATKDHVGDLSKVKSDERLPLGRSARSQGMVVSISEESATKLREDMNKLNDQLFKSIKDNEFKCGSATINRVEQGERDMPSFFYDIRCPESCPDAPIGAPVFREVALTTAFFKNVDSDKQKYEVKFRRQVVGCCLEENDRKPDFFTHPVVPTEPSVRR